MRAETRLRRAAAVGLRTVNCPRAGIGAAATPSSPGAAECGSSRSWRQSCWPPAASRRRAAAGRRRRRDGRLRARRGLAELQPRSCRHAVLAAEADLADERRRAAAGVVVSARRRRRHGARRLGADAARHRRGAVRDGRRSRRRAARAIPAKKFGASRSTQGAPSRRGLSVLAGRRGGRRAHFFHGRDARSSRSTRRRGRKRSQFGSAGEVPMPTRLHRRADAFRGSADRRLERPARRRARL